LIGSATTIEPNRITTKEPRADEGERPRPALGDRGEHAGRGAADHQEDGHSRIRLSDGSAEVHGERTEVEAAPDPDAFPRVPDGAHR
jgi:hypothetical protein